MPWDELRYAAFARAFHWPPPIVDELPLVVEPWLLPIAAAMDAEDTRRQNEAIEAEQRKAKGRRGLFHRN